MACGINYTLFGDEHPEASVRSQSLEVRDAVPVAIERAADLGYTIDQMAVAGGSASGCLALIHAYRDGAKAPVPLRMVFEAVGPASMNRKDWASYGLDKDTDAAAGLLGTMAGVTLTPEEVESGEYLEKVRDVSAVDWVGPEPAPMREGNENEDRNSRNLPLHRTGENCRHLPARLGAFVCAAKGH